MPADKWVSGQSNMLCLDVAHEELFWRNGRLISLFLLLSV
jgi:hypothetical protein